MLETGWRSSARRELLPVIGIMMLGVLGCGRGGLPTVPVRGQVKFVGGPCPAPGNVTFTPVEVEPGLPRRPGSATFHADGQFAITSFQKEDGLLPGRYKVSITCLSGMPDPSKPDPWSDVSYVPSSYQPPELVVARDSDPIELTYDVPAKKK